MSLTDLQQTIVSYFVARYAADMTITDRSYPYGDLVLVWADKFNVATRKFGPKVRAQSKPAAAAFLDLLIEKGAYSTKVDQDFGGSMHAFHTDTYRRVIGDLQETDPIIQKSRQSGDDFWSETFAALAPQTTE